MTLPVDGRVEAIKVCKINSMASSSTQPPAITHSLMISNDLSWKLNIHGHPVLPSSTELLSRVPVDVDGAALNSLISIVETSTVCPGNSDEHFIEMAKEQTGKFLSKSGEVRACLESDFPVSHNGSVRYSTIRTSCCEIIVFDGRQ